MQLKNNRISMIQIKLFDIARYCLMFILLIIPFQPKIYLIIQSWNSQAANFFNKLDESTVILFFPIAAYILYKHYKRGEINFLLYGILFLSISVIIIIGLISGLLNGNSYYITANGTFDYIKTFLLIFIYAAFFREFIMFQKIFRLFLIVAVIIGFVAFIEESWVLYSRYSSAAGSGWRLGVYRAQSLLSHYNLLGLYSLFILNFYLYRVKKVKVLIVFSLLTGIFTSVSRTAYTGFAFMAGLQVFKGRKWLIVFLVPVITALIVMGLYGDDVKMSELGNDGNSAEYNDKVTYREFASNKAMKVWKDHPVWGAGPGMFGGSIAFKYRSPLYEEYNFLLILDMFYSLDQLWPQVLAEMGIVGTAALAGLFVSLLYVLFISRQQTTSDEIKNLLAGLSTFTIIFLISTFSVNLNNIAILYPYCAFVGIGLGCLERPRLTGVNELT